MTRDDSTGTDFPERSDWNGFRDDDRDETRPMAGSTTDELPDEEPEVGDNEDFGLNDDEEPSAGAYASESAAPLTEDTREEVKDRISGRASWESANETGDPTGNETENGPDVDPNDPNLSATLTEAGVEERKDLMGMTDIEPFLDDPENMDEET
jgi:hypothetical protein